MKYFFLLILILAEIGCSSPVSQKSDVFTLEFQPGKTIKKYDLSTIIDSIFRIIPLETKPECLIANIDKLEIVDGKFIILDKMGKSILLFDDKGKFISRIKKIGKGPGQYLEITSMTATKDSIIVFDINLRKQLVYDYQGNLLSEEMLLKKLWAMDVFELNNTLYYVNDYSDSELGKYRLFSMNKGSDEIGKFLEFDKREFSLTINGPIYSKYSKGASMIYSGCDTIFSLDNGKVKAKYRVDFKAHKATTSSNRPEDLILESTDNSEVLGIDAINESDDYLFIRINGTNDVWYMILHKKTQEYFITDENFLMGQFGGKLCHVMRIINDKIYDYADASNLLFSYNYGLEKNEFKNRSFKVKLDSVIQNISEDSNPVIFEHNIVAK